MKELDKITEFIRFSNLDLDISESHIGNNEYLKIDKYEIRWLPEVQRYRILSEDNTSYPIVTSYTNFYDVISYIVISITKRNLKYLEYKYKEESNK